MDVLFGGLSPVQQAAVLAVVLLAFVSLLPQFKRKFYLSKLPLFGATFSGEQQRQFFLNSAKQLYRDGYAKFRDTAYRIASADEHDTVVVPLSVLPELRKLPDDVLSLPLALETGLETKYTKLNPDLKSMLNAVKSDLTPALGRLNAGIRDEIESALEANLPSSHDWTPIPMYETLAKTVARVSGHIFIGPGYCEDSEYIDCAINYTTDIMATVHAVKNLRPWLRPLLANRLPEVQRLRARERRAAKFFEPLVRQRQAAAQNDASWKAPEDMMQWMMGRSPSDIDVAGLAKDQLQLTFAAVHTTTTTATNVLYTLAATPEYIAPLRAEIRSVMAAHDGELSHKALQQLDKLDSYMKEVMRCFPLEVSSFTRYTHRGIALSTGQYIPPGVMLEAAADAMYRDSSIWPDAGRFDGFRHCKLRQEAGGGAAAAARGLFAAANEHNLVFGYGRHACPGRFFAANEVKLIVATTILGWDVSLPEGVMERYAQVEVGKIMAPDPTKVLRFRRMRDRD